MPIYLRKHNILCAGNTYLKLNRKLNFCSKLDLFLLGQLNLQMYDDLECRRSSSPFILLSVL